MLTKQQYIAAGIALVALGIGGKLALDSHDARIKAEAQVAPLQQQVAAAQKQIADAKQEQQRANADLQAQLAAIAKQRTIVITPQQAAQAIPQIVPNLPEPVHVQPDPVKPDAQQIVIPQADIPNFQQYVLDCKEKDARLSACAVNFAAEQQKTVSLGDQLKATETERDSWKKAAQGGFWHRLKECGIRTGIGGASGAVAGGQKGAAIGGAIGIGSCLIFK